jgi:hypothetical protein
MLFFFSNSTNIAYHLITNAWRFFSRSLDKIYKKNGPIPMDVLKKIAYAVSSHGDDASGVLALCSTPFYMILLLNHAPHSSFRSLMALYTYTITTASFIEVSPPYILEIKVI